MRTSAIISSSLLAIAVRCAPIDLPVVNGALDGLNANGLVQSVPDVNSVLKRDLPVVDGALKGVNAGGLVSGVVGTVGGTVDGLVKIPAKRGVLPVVDGVVSGLNVDGIVDPVLKGVPVVNGLKVTRDIKQTLPVVGGADVPLDAGEIQVGKVDQQVGDLVKGIKVDNLKVARDVDQTLPVVGNLDVPLDAGKIQVGTVDKDVLDVVNGLSLNDKPVLDVVKGTTVKNLPNLGAREIKQTLPVVGGADVPLDAGKITVGTVDKDVLAVVEGTKIGA